MIVLAVIMVLLAVLIVVLAVMMMGTGERGICDKAIHKLLALDLLDYVLVVIVPQGPR